jgi:PPK2 family polyphosphate:nucleotide phosphotransferase
MRNAKQIAEPYRVRDGRSFRLRDVDPADTGTFQHKREAEAALGQGTALLRELQDKLYAQDRWALLLVFQAMDAAGKDGTIKHVMSGVNPQGCQVHSFKPPSAEELDHDFLWRSARALPERGRIGIFNRSHYEEVLVVRVHPEILARQRIPHELVTPDIWRQRYDDINAFERYLTRNGVAIRKFFLHLSREEQRRRFLSRLEEPEKNWKFSIADAEERQHWNDYMTAYEEMIRHTSTTHAPWYVVPADHKWFTRVAVSAAIVDALQGLSVAYPTVDAAKRKELAAVREALENEPSLARGARERPAKDARQRKRGHANGKGARRREAPRATAKRAPASDDDRPSERSASGDARKPAAARRPRRR